MKTNLHRIAADALLNISPEMIGKVKLVIPPAILGETPCTLLLKYNGTEFPFRLICLDPARMREDIVGESRIHLVWKPEGMDQEELHLSMIFLECGTDKDWPDCAIKTGVYKIIVEKTAAIQKPFANARVFNLATLSASRPLKVVTSFGSRCSS